MTERCASCGAEPAPSVDECRRALLKLADETARALELFNNPTITLELAELPEGFADALSNSPTVLTLPSERYKPADLEAAYTRIGEAWERIPQAEREQLQRALGAQESTPEGVEQVSVTDAPPRPRDAAAPLSGVDAVSRYLQGYTQGEQETHEQLIALYSKRGADAVSRAFERGDHVRFREAVLTPRSCITLLQQLRGVKGGLDDDENRGVVWLVLGSLEDEGIPVPEPTYRLQTLDGKRTCWARQHFLEKVEVDE